MPAPASLAAQAPAAPAPAAPEQPAAISDIELLTWSAATMPKHERSPRWYLITGGIFLLFMIVSILWDAWSFAVVVMLLGGVYYLVHRKPPPLKTISIRGGSCVFDGDVTPWRECVGFWFLPGEGYTELHIERRGKPDIVIHTGPYSMEDLRSILVTFLPELTNRREKLLDKLIRICKL